MIVLTEPFYDFMQKCDMITIDQIVIKWYCIVLSRFRFWSMQCTLKSDDTINIATRSYPYHENSRPLAGSFIKRFINIMIPIKPIQSAVWTGRCPRKFTVNLSVLLFISFSLEIKNSTFYFYRNFFRRKRPLYHVLYLF